MKYRFKPSDTDGKATRRPLKALGAVKITHWWKNNRLLNQKSLNNEAKKRQNKDSETVTTGRRQQSEKRVVECETDKKKTLQLRHKQAEKSKHGPRNRKETKSTGETEKYWAETIRKTCLQAEKISKTTISKKGLRVILMKNWTACDRPTNQRLRKRRDVTGKWRKYQTTTKNPTELSRRDEKKAWVGITENRKREKDEKKRGGKMWSEDSSSEWQQIARFSFSPCL